MLDQNGYKDKYLWFVRSRTVSGYVGMDVKWSSHIYNKQQIKVTQGFMGIKCNYNPHSDRKDHAYSSQGRILE